MSDRARLLRSTILLMFVAACSHSTAAPGPSPRPTPTTAVAPTATPEPTDDPHPGLIQVLVPAELKYAGPDNFTGAPLPGYERDNVVLLRLPAARALRLVADRLRAQGISVLVYDAYRPVRATLAMVAWAHRVHRDDLVGPYIASHSEHNLGVAVDLTLERDGHPLDMGAPFDTFGSGAHYANASGEAAANRRLLRDAMISAGWRPYDFEWWHFSFPVPGATPLDYPIR